VRPDVAARTGARPRDEARALVVQSRRTATLYTPQSMTASGFTPLARFHLRVGARLALRAAAPLAGLPFVIVLLQQDPSGALRALAAWLLGPSGGANAGLALAAVSLALAGWAAPRVTTGLGGWPRHLPVTQTVHRRAALVALATAQAPVVVGLLLLAPAAAHQAGGIVPGRLAALPVTVAAAALASWPGAHAWRSRPLAWAALLLAAAARLALVPVALVLVLAAERVAGPLAAHGAARRRRRASALPLPLLLAARALGPAALGAVVASLAPVAAMTLLRVNNDLSPAVAAGAARLGAGIGVVVLLAALAEMLAIRRPVWPWSRSLPVGAARHVGEDALLLAFPCFVPLVATAGLDVVAALTVAACLPSLALLAAGALRPSTPAETGVAVGPLGGGALLAAWVAVLPWLALLALAAAPLAWWAAAARDRRQKVSRWDELHHRAVGDPLSWSAR
jgi:hypothetical protein